MRYPAHILEDIRARLPVSSVVGRRVRLKKAGREWRGLSPFNAEKTPSFYANDQKQFYHCFSSGKHGDIFSFLIETEGVSFPEAVERLAQEAGVDLPRPTPESAAQETRYRSLHEVMELACLRFEAVLQTPAGRAARAYLEGRGIGPDLQQTFRLGFAPADRFGLRDHLAEKDVESELMTEAGLLISGEDVAVPYDRFRDRIMFPIEDGRGRVVAFGGRAMNPDAPAKYLNSPETTLFSKGRLLYNLHRARGPAHQQGTVIAVEGYVDVIALSKVGIGHAVAPLGTALTEDQLALLWRIADEPILCFDGDQAGRRAAHRAATLALGQLMPGKSVRFALLPQGQDPDDLARQGGKSALDAVLAASRPLVDVVWARESEAAPTDTPERRAAFATRLRDAVATIRDETLRRFYRDEIEARLRETRRGAVDRGEVGRKRFGGPVVAPTGFLGRPLQAASPELLTRFAGPASVSSAREALIVGTLIAHPAALHGQADALATLDMSDRDARALCSLLLDAALQADEPSSTTMEARIERAGLTEALVRLKQRVRPGDRWMLEPAVDMVRLDDAVKQAFTLQRRSRTLNSEKAAAASAFVEDQSEANFTWLQEVNAEIQSLDGTEAERGATP